MSDWGLRSGLFLASTCVLQTRIEEQVVAMLRARQIDMLCEQAMGKPGSQSICFHDLAIRSSHCYVPSPFEQ